MRSCFASSWRLFRGSGVLTPGYYYFSPKGTPFYPGLHNYWSRDWISDELDPYPPLGEAPGKRTYFKGGRVLAALAPAALVGSADCVSGGDVFPPPVGLVVLAGLPAACWGSSPPSPGSINVIEDVTTSDGLTDCPLIATLDVDVSVGLKLLCLGSGKARISLTITGTGPLVAQLQGVLKQPTALQIVNGQPGLTVQRFTDAAPTGNLLQLLNAAGGTVLFGVNAAGQLVAGVVPAGNVSGLAPSATTDTTNASNITAGTLPVGQLPVGTLIEATQHLTGNTTNAYATVFDITDTNCLIGGFSLKNTGGVNTIAYRYTAYDVYGTLGQFTGTVAPGAVTKIMFTAQPAGGPPPPFTRFVVEVKDNVPGAHTAWDVYLYTH